MTDCEHDEMGIDDSVDCVICYEVKKALSSLKAELEEASMRDEFMDVMIDGFSYDEIWKKRGM